MEKESGEGEEREIVAIFRGFRAENNLISLF